MTLASEIIAAQKRTNQTLCLVTLIACATAGTLIVRSFHEHKDRLHHAGSGILPNGL